MFHQGLHSTHSLISCVMQSINGNPSQNTSHHLVAQPICFLGNLQYYFDSRAFITFLTLPIPKIHNQRTWKLYAIQFALCFSVSHTKKKLFFTLFVMLTLTLQRIKVKHTRIMKRQKTHFTSPKLFSKQTYRCERQLICLN